MSDSGKSIAFRTRLRMLMNHKGFTPADLARETRISPTNISRYTKGRIPSPLQLLNISQVLGVTMDWLLTGETSASKSIPKPEGSKTARQAEKIRVPLTETTTAILTIFTEEDGLGHIDPPFTRPITLSEFALAIRNLSARKYEIEKP